MSYSIQIMEWLLRHITFLCEGRERKPCMQGHPGSITALHMATVKQGSVYSGSYDTTIRFVIVVK